MSPKDHVPINGPHLRNFIIPVIDRLGVLTSVNAKCINQKKQQADLSSYSHRILKFLRKLGETETPLEVFEASSREDEMI